MLRTNNYHESVSAGAMLLPVASVITGTLTLT